jgi:hypothetical protein|tara:strand:+ start:2672 stop:3118 length:447 start_codon:yes stop_codon:yes gene_type:complete
MAISQAVCSVFKRELLKGNHDFDGTGSVAYYIALYTSSATLGAATTAYSSSNEVTNASGSAYSAGGKALTSPTVTLSGTTAFVDFADISWTSASFTANGALIYRQDGSAPTDDAVVVLAFGGDFTASNGTFTIQFPAAGGGSEIIRLG